MSNLERDRTELRRPGLVLRERRWGPRARVVAGHQLSLGGWIAYPES